MGRITRVVTGKDDGYGSCLPKQIGFWVVALALILMVGVSIYGQFTYRNQNTDRLTAMDRSPLVRGCENHHQPVYECVKNIALTEQTQTQTK